MSCRVWLWIFAAAPAHGCRVSARHDIFVNDSGEMWFSIRCHLYLDIFFSAVA